MRMLQPKWLEKYLILQINSGTFSRTRYANSGSNDVHKWIFTEDNNGNYIVYSNTDKAKCLTVNPSTGNVSLSNYTASKYDIHSSSFDIAPYVPDDQTNKQILIVAITGVSLIPIGGAIIYLFVFKRKKCVE